jgi:signal transduction histidine kinase
MEGAQVFLVRDNGLGIPEAYLPKVFAIFQRLHADRAPGEGIGLALVRRMVERHGGHIWVESVAGEGTTFFVALPRKEKSPLLIAPRKESIRFAGPVPPKS